MQTSWEGRVAVVTGAGSGIGRQLAYALGRRGCRLAVSDVAEEGLAATAATLRADGVRVLAERLDVADRAAVAAHAERVRDELGVAHQVYNNAGVADSGDLLELTYEDLERVLQINLWGVVHGTREFLPQLIASGDGHLVTISSVNAFLAQPRLGAYCTSKAAVRAFTEVVRAEMLRDGHPVRVTVVHPGGVRTNIATASLARSRAAGREVTAADERETAFYNEKLLTADPAAVAEKIVDQVSRGRPRVVVGSHARTIDVITRLAPAQAPRWGLLLGRAITGRRSRVARSGADA